MKNLIYCLLLAVVIPVCAPAAQRFDTIPRSQMIPTTQDVASVAAYTNQAATAFSWGTHAGLYPLISTYASATQSIWTLMGELAAYTNRAATALQAEVDPAWHSGTNAIWTAIANATPGGYGAVSNAAMLAFSYGNWATNNLLSQSVFAGYTNAQHSINTNLSAQVATKADAGDVVAMLGNISNSYVMVDGQRLPYDGEFNARPRYRFSTSVYEWRVHFVGEWEYTKTPEEGAIEVDTNPSTGKLPPPIGWTGGTSIQFFLGADPIQKSAITSTATKVTNLESGVEDFEALNLGGTVIDDYSDIGLTYTNAVRLNAAITITNDSQWTGWTTTGTLDTNTHSIFLGATNQYLISPVQTNGIAYFSAEISSRLNGTTYEAVIWTNGVLASTTTPWRYPNGQVYFRPLAALPGADLGITISNVTITAYADLAEAQTPKEVSNLRVVEDPGAATDVANKRYVDEAEAAAKAFGTAQLATYAADKTKTLRGAELRLGNMWVVSPADTSGERFIVSGGEISGNGELIGTTNEFIIAKNDYPLMSFKSDASGLFISNFTVSATSSNLVWTLRIATNGVHSAPFAEWTENLVVGEWSRVLTCQTNTYPVASNGTYTLTFCVPTNRACFVRAMQQEGSSVSKVLTDILDVGGAAVTSVTTLTTTGGVEIVSTVQALGTNAMTKAVYDTNGDDTVDHAQSADTAGYADNSGALGGQPPSYYLTTNSLPKSRKETQQGILSSSQSVGSAPASISSDLSYPVFQHFANANSHRFSMPNGATNIYLPMLFSYNAMPTNFAVRVLIDARTITSEGKIRASTPANFTSIIATNGGNGSTTNLFFILSAPISTNHFNEGGGIIRVYTSVPSTGSVTNYLTNYFGLATFDVVTNP